MRRRVKDTLRQLLTDWLGPYGIPVLVVRGFGSQSYVDVVRERTAGDPRAAHVAAGAPTLNEMAAAMGDVDADDEMVKAAPSRDTITPPAHGRWAAVLVGTFAGYPLGALYGGGLILAGPAGRKTTIPFGPFLIAGALVGVLVGSHPEDWAGPSWRRGTAARRRSPARAAHSAPRRGAGHQNDPPKKCARGCRFRQAPYDAGVRERHQHER